MEGAPKYQPSSEEMKTAEESMTEEQKRLSEYREPRVREIGEKIKEIEEFEKEVKADSEKAAIEATREKEWKEKIEQFVDKSITVQIESKGRIYTDENVKITKISDDTIKITNNGGHGPASLVVPFKRIVNIEEFQKKD